MSSAQTKTVKKAKAKAVKAIVRAETKAIKAESKAVVRAAADGVKVSQNELQLANLMREFNLMKKTMKRSIEPGVARYLACLIKPSAATMYRLPDGFNVPTALVHSTAIWEITGEHNAASNTGRFSVLVTPTLTQSQYGFCQMTQQWYGMVPSTPAADPQISVVLAAQAAIYRPTSQWDPSTSFKSVLPSAKTASSKIPLEPPIGISGNSYDFYADPNASTIGGTVSDAGSGSYYTNGLAENLRPIGMSVWFQCTASDLQNGGDVAACLLPPNSYMGGFIPYNYLTATTGAGVWANGPYQNWEQLALVPNSYNGKLKDGTFSYWRPERLTDIDMKSVQENQTADFPYIIVSGQAQTTDVIVGKITVETVYEYTTSSQIPSLAKGDCIENVLDKIKCILYDQPTSMANGSHEKWWKTLLRTAGAGVVGFLTGGPAGAALGIGTSLAAM